MKRATTERDRPGEIPAEAYSAAFDAAPDGILIVQADGRIRHVNPEACALFGYGEDELIGKTVEALMPESMRAGHERSRVGYVSDPARRPMNAGLQLFALRKDQTTVPVEISLSPACLEGDQVVVAIVRDVSEANRLRAFSTGNLKAAENERRRIAQELHDDTAQRLAAVKLALKRVEGMEADEYHQLCGDLRTEIGAIAQDVSRIARGLRPPELDRIGVVEAVRAWVQHRIGEEGPEATITAEPVDELLDQDQRLVLYRIVQEALSNVVRHADASRVAIRMRDRAGVVETTIQDNGVGFDVSQTNTGLKSLGLLGIKERAAMVGALVSIASVPGRGATVRVVMKKKGD